MVALDFDPASVLATGGNALINGVEVSVRRFDLRSPGAVVPVARTVAANLLGPLLREWAARLAGGSEPVPERLIASGLLVAEADGIVSAFGAAGLRRCAGSSPGSGRRCCWCGEIRTKSSDFVAHGDRSPSRATFSAVCAGFVARDELGAPGVTKSVRVRRRM